MTQPQQPQQRQEQKQPENIYEAHRQWATRPPDECFQTLEELHNFCSGYRERSYTASLPVSLLKAVPTGADEIRLVLRHSLPGLPKMDNSPIPRSGLSFTNFSFKQFCSHINASDATQYLSRLPADIACLNINCGLDNTEPKSAKLLLQREGSKGKESTFLKAATSRIYNRIWNSEVTAFLLRVNKCFDNRLSPPFSWVNNGEGKGNNGAEDNGDKFGTGLYASDHDMFAFLVDSEKAIDGISGSELVRGFYIYNNEVGSGSLGLCAFLYDMVCGNHIIWGVKDLVSVSTRHIGRAATQMLDDVFPAAVSIQMLSDTREQVAKIKAAQKKTLGRSKQKVMDYLFEKRFATRALANQAWNYAEERDGLNPMTVWGIVQGITAVARPITFTDKRVQVEKSAAKLLELV